MLPIIFVLAGLLMAAGVTLDVNRALNGALNTCSGGTGTAVVALVMAVSTLAELRALLLVVGTVLSLLHMAQHPQWGWLVVLFILLPAGLYAFLTAGFEAGVLASLAALVTPVAYLL